MDHARTGESGAVGTVSITQNSHPATKSVKEEPGYRTGTLPIYRRFCKKENLGTGVFGS